nr:PH domain-containing protein [Salisaeta longa]
MASDALGISDIGTIIPPEDYDKTASDDYILHEDGEKIFFLIKSKQDEYCFTNRALIHVDGQSAQSTKRTLKRYEYYKHPISSVTLETAGRVDRDVEIKFGMGNQTLSLDIEKDQLSQLKDLYKTLIEMALIAEDNQRKRREAEESLDKTTHILQSGNHEGVNKGEAFKAVHTYIHEAMQSAYTDHTRKDFGAVFSKYIKN